MPKETHIYHPLPNGGGVWKKPMNNKEWQPIETAPKNGAWIIAIETRFPDVVFKCRMDFVKGCGGFIMDWQDRDGEIVFPAYWTPMPEIYPLEKTPNPYKKNDI